MSTYDTLQVDISTPNDGQGDPLRTAFDKINQRFQVLRIFVSNRGDWAPNTVYTADPNRDWVIVDGVGYLATSNHTSGATFAADFAAGKWVAADALLAIAEVDTLRDDLASTAAGKGAELVAFKQGGVAAAARTVKDKLRGLWIDVRDYGAVGDGVADDTAAVEAAVAAAKQIHALNKALMPSINYEIGANQVQLVTVTLTGGPGFYKVSNPIVFSRVKGFKVNSLNLIASDTFVGDYLVVVGDSGAYLGADNFTYENSLLNANFKAGVFKFTDTIRCLLLNDEILGFNTNGVYITADHPPSFGNYETQVVNCYICTTPSGGTVPPGVVLNDTVGILVNNTDNVFRNNQIFKVGVGIKTLSRSGNDLIQGNHIYSASLYAMDINSYPNIITSNYFDNFNLLLRQPIYAVVTNNYFFGNTDNATNSFIVLRPPQANYYFQRLTIKDNNFLNVGSAKCESIVVDTSVGTFDYENTKNVDITGNVFSNVKFVGSKVRQVINLDNEQWPLLDLRNTQAIGNIGILHYSVRQATPSPSTSTLTHAITSVNGSQAAIRFSAPLTGTIYVEYDINTLSDNTV